MNVTSSISRASTVSSETARDMYRLSAVNRATGSRLCSSIHFIAASSLLQTNLFPPFMKMTWRKLLVAASLRSSENFTPQHLQFTV
jgi:hypothetical protein